MALTIIIVETMIAFSIKYHIYLPVSIIFLVLLVYVFIKKNRKIFDNIKKRIGNSKRWPKKIKILNGIAWTCPFILIIVIPDLTNYLILSGIALGNITTYIFMNKYSNYNNQAQLILGLVSSLSIPVIFTIQINLLPNKHQLAILARIAIIIAFGISGIFALKKM